MESDAWNLNWLLILGPKASLDVFPGESITLLSETFDIILDMCMLSSDTANFLFFDVCLQRVARGISSVCSLFNNRLTNTLTSCSCLQMLTMSRFSSTNLLASSNTSFETIV